MEIKQPHCSVEVLHQRRATFHPIPAIEIAHAADVFDFCPMNVTADDAMDFLFSRHLRDGLLVVRNVFHRLLGFEFQVRRD